MLYNPFYAWTKDLLDALIEAGHSYFVRQSFARGKANAPDTVKHVFQIFYYAEQTHADRHFQQLKKLDTYSAFYDINIAEDKEKLIKTTDQYKEYQFFSNTMYPDWKIRLKFYERKLRTCIENDLNWHPKGKDKVWVGLHSGYGAMHITFKLGHDKAQFLFDHIEKLPPCAMILPYSLRLSWSPTIYQP